jgi:hypothetical protein
MPNGLQHAQAIRRDVAAAREAAWRLADAVVTGDGVWLAVTLVALPPVRDFRPLPGVPASSCSLVQRLCNDS